MKIDLHVHIHRTSRCARQEPEEMAEKAKEKGLDGIVILDHHYFPTVEECKRTERLTGIKIFQGIEISVKSDSNAISGVSSGGNDIVVISPVPPTFNFGQYHKPIWEDDLPKLLEYVKNTQGLSILAHPFRKDKPLSINPSGIDCIEIASKNTSWSNRKKILETAEHYGMICVSTSDAHKTRSIGHYYIDTDREVNNEVELATEIKAKRFTLFETRVAPVLMCPRNA